MPSCSVHVRWRPSSDGPCLSHRSAKDEASGSRYNLNVSGTLANGRQLEWTSPSACFSSIFHPSHTNLHVFQQLIEPALEKLLSVGGSALCFAYGHTGSGKTHTIIGYGKEAGLSRLAAQRILSELQAFNARAGLLQDTRLGLAVRLVELRKSTVLDLMNHRTECHVRQGADGRMHVRGATEMLEDGKVRVRPTVARACWDMRQLDRALEDALSLRSVGTSPVHNQSSRTHAVLEFEIVHRHLIAARELVIQRESELVPVGKRATDVYIEEQMRGMIIDEDGKGYKPNPAYTIDQERIDVAEAAKAECEDRLDAAKRAAEELLANAKMRAQSVGAPVAGTRLVFVDLAGAEYSTGSVAAAPQTSLERQEGRQINTDLLALKEVIRARASRQSRIPYRNSPLTMVLKEHFEHELAPQDTSFMILNVAEASAQLTATVNTLQFGSLVGLVAG
ncbi:Kinesin-like protein [Ceraceosorus bombacis]|uniref:Kinesin-like protein n=1 Tax=Ceraceosorus bombacis TaxID=401625 RepID=A0A0N7LAI6_9BASI|nr:Kinesin-like protein [Ceraceosorus bombacis]